MPVFEEYDYRFALPDGRTFRLGACSTYVHGLKGRNMKEMDFGWIAPDGDAVWLLEVKNFDHSDAEPFDRDALFDDLVQKATDGLLMLASMWACVGVGPGLLRDVQATCPGFPPAPVTVRLVLMLKFKGADAQMQAMTLGDEVRTRLRGRMKCLPADLIPFSLDHASSLSIDVQPLT